MKLIVFDCDGTIADSQHMIAAAMGGAFRDHDLAAPERADVLGVVGLSLDLAVAQLLPENNRDPAFVQDVAESYRRAFMRLRANPNLVEPLYEGAREIITDLAAREDVVLGIATGKSRRGVDRLLSREDLEAYFVTIQTADEHPSKPDPSMIYSAMAEVGTSPAQTVVVGDTTFDIDMAKSAGAGAIGVTWGYHTAEDLERSRPHALVDTYATLAQVIDGVLSRRSEEAA